MKPNFNLCDRCSAQVATRYRIPVVTGSQRNPSGNGYEDIIEPIDLCHSCLYIFVVWQLDKLSESLVSISPPAPSGFFKKDLIEFSKKSTTPIN